MKDGVGVRKIDSCAGHDREDVGREHLVFLQHDGVPCGWRRNRRVDPLGGNHDPGEVFFPVDRIDAGVAQHHRARQ